MSIPAFHIFMLPILKSYSDGKEYPFRKVQEKLSLHFELKDEDLREKLSSGQQTVFASRTGWARTYLKKACLIEPTSKGVYRITDRGLEVLRKKPAKLNSKFLKQFAEFREFITPKHRKDVEEKIIDETKTPQE